MTEVLVCTVGTVVLFAPHQPGDAVSGLQGAWPIITAHISLLAQYSRLSQWEQLSTLSSLQTGHSCPHRASQNAAPLGPLCLCLHSCQGNSIQCGVSVCKCACVSVREMRQEEIEKVVLTLGHTRLGCRSRAAQMPPEGSSPKAQKSNRARNLGVFGKHDGTGLIQSFWLH